MHALKNYTQVYYYQLYVKILQEPENYVTKNSTIVGSWGCGDVLEEGSKGNYMLCLACDQPMQKMTPLEDKVLCR